MFGGSGVQGLGGLVLGSFREGGGHWGYLGNLGKLREPYGVVGSTRFRV